MSGSDASANRFSAFLGGLDEINRALHAGEITESEATARKDELRAHLAAVTASSVAGTSTDSPAPHWLGTTPASEPVTAAVPSKAPAPAVHTPAVDGLETWSGSQERSTKIRGRSASRGGGAAIFLRSLVVLVVVAAIVAAIAYHLTH